MNEEGQVAELENDAVVDDVEVDAVAGSDFVATAATLVVKRNGAETEESFVVNSPCVIGRFDPAVGPIDIDLGNIPEGVYVSRKHAKITQDDGVWKIHDLGSSNGTFVLGDDFMKVEEAEITDGTEIALGNARFVFHLS
jgi:pSer/pThr/pTyr-binding forkhead associated (FHA) protein